MVVLTNQSQTVINSIIMKKLITLLVIFANVCCAQGQGYYDNFDGAVYIQGNQLYYTDLNQAQSALGTPDDIEHIFWEISEREVTCLNYNEQDNLCFADNFFGALMLEGFSLNTPHFSLLLDEFELKVGFHIDVLQDRFPLSYQNRGSGSTALTLGEGDYDYLFIRFNTDGIIKGLEHRVF